MNERLANRSSGLSTRGLRVWAMLFLTIGIVGQSIVQNRLLGVGQLSVVELAALMDDPGVFGIVTFALICRGIYTCAAPIFAFLLVEGVKHTSSFRKYFLRITGLALISEIPYDLAINGKILELGGQNPVFGMVLCMLVLYFYRRYKEKSAANILIKLVVTIAGILWSSMLRIDDGASLVLLTAVLWAFREKSMLRLLAGCTAAFACSFFSLYYVVSPMSILTIHFYNGEKGEENRVFSYLFFPLLLIACFAVSKMI